MASIKKRYIWFPATVILAILIISVMEESDHHFEEYGLLIGHLLGFNIISAFLYFNKISWLKRYKSVALYPFVISMMVIGFAATRYTHAGHMDIPIAGVSLIFVWFTFLLYLIRPKIFEKQYLWLVVSILLSIVLIREMQEMKLQDNEDYHEHTLMLIHLFAYTFLLILKLFSKYPRFHQNERFHLYPVGLGIILLSTIITEESAGSIMPPAGVLLIWPFAIYMIFYKSFEKWKPVAGFLSIDKNPNTNRQDSSINRYKKTLIISCIGLVLISGMLAFKESNEDFFIFFQVMFILLIFYVVISWLFEQWRNIKQLKSDKISAELMLLKSQINPHFFFNTLNNLYGLTVEKSDKAPEVVLKISDMMRYTIYEGKKDKVPLEDELEYLKNYIELHKIRYHKKVDIQFNHHIQGDEYEITPLLYIILLENAFKHGVENLTDDAYIKIQLIAGNDKILFAIENNFDPNEIEEKDGIGLGNLRRRLELLYPKKHKLSFSNKDKIYKAQLDLELN
ncbi:histidine kinase [Fulvivirgaceae bacterium BMA10]|uniref:Histidine kinase n=1 Tax=Splendidivirga corallicola TaxID=3051826 RepID=A0ABT8KLA3_9BACT|nr:histidine kinase [Fulvivirgaceae bacterium BMA10]